MHNHRIKPGPKIAIINDFDSGELLVKLNAEGDDFEYGGDETVLTEYPDSFAISTIVMPLPHIPISFIP